MENVTYWRLFDNLTTPNDSESDTNVSYITVYTSLFEARQNVRIVFIVFYLATFVFGLVGNSLVIYIIGYFTSERVKSVANYYIWSLAFADLIFVLSLPLFCWATAVERWPLSGLSGTVSCKLAYVGRDITKFASAWTLVALSVDRSIASSYELSHFRTIKSCKIVICVIWLCCLLASSHYFIFAQTIRGKCKLHITSFQFTWTILQVLLGYVLPSVGIYTSYCVLWKRMKKRMMGTRGPNSNFSKSSRCMTRTVFVVVVTFTLCQTPYHSFLVYNLFPRPQMTSVTLVRYAKIIVYVNATSQILVFIASCCNPIIYGLMNFNFRRLYMTAVRGCWQNLCSGPKKTSSVATNVDLDKETDPLPRTTELSTLTSTAGKTKKPNANGLLSRSWSEADTAYT